MSDATLGRITSVPNQNGEHSLKCPECNISFLSTITRDDETGIIAHVTCDTCDYSNEPRFFIAAAHQAEINNMAMDYASKQLKKMLKGSL